MLAYYITSFHKGVGSKKQYAQKCDVLTSLTTRRNFVEVTTLRYFLLPTPTLEHSYSLRVVHRIEVQRRLVTPDNEMQALTSNPCIYTIYDMW